jgi:hypothetical protein
MCLTGGGGGGSGSVESIYTIQLYNVYLASVRTYQIALLPQTKT